MSIIQINTGLAADNNQGDTLRNASIKINRNDFNLDAAIQNEGLYLTDALAEVAKVNVRNTFTGNIIYENYTVLPGTSVTPAFTNTTPDFHFTDEGDITLNNPLDIGAGKNQKGIIISEGKIVSFGSMWKPGVDSGITHNTYVYRYVQVNEALILISLMAGY